MQRILSTLLALFALSAVAGSAAAQTSRTGPSPTLTSGPLSPAAPPRGRAHDAAPRAPWFVSAPFVSAHPRPSRESRRGGRTRREVIGLGLGGLLGGYLGWVATSIGWNIVNTDCATRSSGTYGLIPNIACVHNGRGPDGNDILRSLIPVAGAWLSVFDSETLRGADLTAPVVAGLVQAAGVALLAIGLILAEVDDDGGASEPLVELRLSPTRISITGQFN